MTVQKVAKFTDSEDAMKEIEKKLNEGYLVKHMVNVYDLSQKTEAILIVMEKVIHPPWI